MDRESQDALDRLADIAAYDILLSTRFIDQFSVAACAFPGFNVC